MPNNARIYICNCAVYCIIPTEVSRSTYYSHAAHRNQLPISFGDFAALPPQPNVPINNGEGSGLEHEQVGIPEDRPYPNRQEKRRCIRNSPDRNIDEEVEVRDYAITVQSVLILFKFDPEQG